MIPPLQLIRRYKPEGSVFYISAFDPDFSASSNKEPRQSVRLKAVGTDVTFSVEIVRLKDHLLGSVFPEHECCTQQREILVQAPSIDHYSQQYHESIEATRTSFCRAHISLIPNLIILPLIPCIIPPKSGFSQGELRFDTGRWEQKALDAA